MQPSGESSVILLHPPLPVVGVSIGMGGDREQSDSLADGYLDAAAGRDSIFAMLI